MLFCTLEVKLYTQNDKKVQIVFAFFASPVTGRLIVLCKAESVVLSSCLFPTKCKYHNIQFSLKASIIWISNILALSVPDEGYSRNA